MKYFCLSFIVFMMNANVFAEVGSAIESPEHVRARLEEARLYFGNRVTRIARNCTQQIDSDFTGTSGVSFIQEPQTFRENLLYSMGSMIADFMDKQGGSTKVGKFTMSFKGPDGKNHKYKNCLVTMMTDTTKNLGFTTDGCVDPTGHISKKNFNCFFEENVAAHNDSERQFQKNLEESKRVNPKNVRSAVPR